VYSKRGKVIKIESPKETYMSAETTTREKNKRKLDFRKTILSEKSTSNLTLICYFLFSILH